MRAIIQRVSEAHVSVEGIITGKIGKGLVALVGVAPDDDLDDLDFVKRKLLNLRIFPDRNGRFNLSLAEVQGEILLVSQFTLFGDCRKGNRPSFSRAASPALAESLYQELKEQLAQSGIGVASGVFAAHMEVSMINDGPVTLILDSKKELY